MRLFWAKRRSERMPIANDEHGLRRYAIICFVEDRKSSDPQGSPAMRFPKCPQSTVQEVQRLSHKQSFHLKRLRTLEKGGRVLYPFLDATFFSSYQRMADVEKIVRPEDCVNVSDKEIYLQKAVYEEIQMVDPKRDMIETPIDDNDPIGEFQSGKGLAATLKLPSQHSAKRENKLHNGYVVVAFKTMEHMDNREFVSNWKTWTGVRFICMQLPKQLGLRRISFYRQLSLTSDFTYVLLIEISNLMLYAAQTLNLMDCIKLRLCGYVGVYREIDFEVDAVSSSLLKIELTEPPKRDDESSGTSKEVKRPSVAASSKQDLSLPVPKVSVVDCNGNHCANSGQPLKSKISLKLEGPPKPSSLQPVRIDIDDYSDEDADKRCGDVNNQSTYSFQILRQDSTPMEYTPDADTKILDIDTSSSLPNSQYNLAMSKSSSFGSNRFPGGSSVPQSKSFVGNGSNGANQAAVPQSKSFGNYVVNMIPEECNLANSVVVVKPQLHIGQPPAKQAAPKAETTKSEGESGGKFKSGCRKLGAEVTVVPSGSYRNLVAMETAPDHMTQAEIQESRQKPSASPRNNTAKAQAAAVNNGNNAGSTSSDLIQFYSNPDINANIPLAYSNPQISGGHRSQITATMQPNRSNRNEDDLNNNDAAGEEEPLLELHTEGLGQTRGPFTNRTIVLPPAPYPMSRSKSMKRQKQLADGNKDVAIELDETEDFGDWKEQLRDAATVFHEISAAAIKSAAGDRSSPPTDRTGSPRRVLRDSCGNLFIEREITNESLSGVPHVESADKIKRLDRNIEEVIESMRRMSRSSISLEGGSPLLRCNNAYSDLSPSLLSQLSPRRRETVAGRALKEDLSRIADEEAAFSRDRARSLGTLLGRGNSRRIRSQSVRPLGYPEMIDAETETKPRRRLPEPPLVKSIELMHEVAKIVAAGKFAAKNSDERNGNGPSNNGASMQQEANGGLGLGGKPRKEDNSSKTAASPRVSPRRLPQRPSVTATKRESVPAVSPQPTKKLSVAGLGSGSGGKGAISPEPTRKSSTSQGGPQATPPAAGKQRRMLPKPPIAPKPKLQK